MQWFEFLMAFVFAIAGFMAPIWLLYFQKENEATRNGRRSNAI